MSRRRAFWFAFVMGVFALIAGISAHAAKPQPPRPPYCKFVLCAYPDCLPTEHTEIPAGQCCPVCVPN